MTDVTSKNWKFMLRSFEVDNLVKLIDEALDVMTWPEHDLVDWKEVVVWTTILRKLGKNNKATDWEAKFQTQRDQALRLNC